MNEIFGTQVKQLLWNALRPVFGEIHVYSCLVVHDHNATNKHMLPFQHLPYHPPPEAHSTKPYSSCDLVHTVPLRLQLWIQEGQQLWPLHIKHWATYFRTSIILNQFRTPDLNEPAGILHCWNQCFNLWHGRMEILQLWPKCARSIVWKKQSWKKRRTAAYCSSVVNIASASVSSSMLLLAEPMASSKYSFSRSPCRCLECTWSVSHRMCYPDFKMENVLHVHCMTWGTQALAEKTTSLVMSHRPCEGVGPLAQTDLLTKPSQIETHHLPRPNSAARGSPSNSSHTSRPSDPHSATAAKPRSKSLAFARSQASSSGEWRQLLDDKSHTALPLKVETVPGSPAVHRVHSVRKPILLWRSSARSESKKPDSPESLLNNAEDSLHAFLLQIPSSNTFW